MTMNQDANPQDAVLETGSGNIFADLELPDAEDMLLKAQMLVVLQRLIRAEGLTQIAAAKRLGISQPDLSHLLRGRLRGYSIERLMRMLTNFGQDVEIVIKPCSEQSRSAKICIAA
jgi:predicted XRE-type DNA-binding protein